MLLALLHLKGFLNTIHLCRRNILVEMFTMQDDGRSSSESRRKQSVVTILSSNFTLGNTSSHVVGSYG